MKKYRITWTAEGERHIKDNYEQTSKKACKEDIKENFPDAKNIVVISMDKLSDHEKELAKIYR